MVLELITPHLTFIKILILFGVLILFLLGSGISYIVKSARINYDKTVSFIHNIMAGITGGIIVGILLDFKEINKTTSTMIERAIPFAIEIAFIIFVIGIITYSNMLAFKKKEENKKKMKIPKIIKNWFKGRFTFPRLIKAFILSVQIGIGVYLGKIFLQFHWFLALIIVTLFLWIFAGSLLDAIWPE